MKKEDKKAETKQSWLDSYRDVKDFFKNLNYSFRPDTQEIIDFTDKTDTKMSVWRDKYHNGQLLPMFIYPRDLQKNDVVFVEGHEFEGYAQITNFEISPEGKIDNFSILPTNFSISRANQMLKVVENLIIAAQQNAGERINVIVALREK